MTLLASFAAFRGNRDVFPRTNYLLVHFGIIAVRGRPSAAPAGALLTVPAALCDRWIVCILTWTRIILTVA